MISAISGIIIDKNPPTLTLETNNISYDIYCPLDVFEKLSADTTSIKLFTYLQIKEDSHSLFGFLDKQTKSIFLSLIKVNGVGAKAAISILSYMSNEKLIDAVVNEKSTMLQKTPGIGAKISKRIVIDLKDEFTKFNLTTSNKNALSLAQNELVNKAIIALKNLGFSQNQSQKAIYKVKDKANSLEQLIKLSLNEL